MKTLPILILISMLTFSCNSKKNLSSDAIKRVWMLTEFKTFSKEYFIKQQAFLDLTNEKIAASKMGCNNLSFPYVIKNNSQISFSDGIATEMFCQDMQLESQFSKAIVQNFTYSIEAHKLTLSFKNGEKIVFIAQDWD